MTILHSYITSPHLHFPTTCLSSPRFTITYVCIYLYLSIYVYSNYFNSVIYNIFLYIFTYISVYERETGKEREREIEGGREMWLGLYSFSFCFRGFRVCWLYYCKLWYRGSILPFTKQKAKYHKQLEAAVDVVERACRLCVEVIMDFICLIWLIDICM